MSGKSLSNAFLSAFCLEVAMLLQAGITLYDGVLMLQDDEPTQEGKEVLQQLLDSLEKGKPLSAALHEATSYPAYLTQMAEIGERTGRLVETLRALSQHYDRQERISASIKNAVLYPAILLVMMVVVVIILIVQVLPIFNEVFNRLGTQMSPVALSLMDFGAWLSGASVGIAIVLGALIILALAVVLVPSLRERVVSTFRDSFGHKGVWGDIANSQFTSAMVLSLSSGLDTQEAVHMAATLGGGNKVLEAKNKQCLEILGTGKTLAEAMLDSGILNARNGRMLSLGTRSGQADAAMAEIAQRSEKDVQLEIDRLVSRIEPTMVIITSVIVGIILLAVMLPLMGIMTSIG